MFPQVTGGSPGLNGIGAPTASLDVRNQLYIILHYILLHHWKAVGNMQGAVLNALEHPFSMTDVALFKQTLEVCYYIISVFDVLINNRHLTLSVLKYGCMSSFSHRTD